MTVDNFPGDYMLDRAPAEPGGEKRRFARVNFVKDGDNWNNVSLHLEEHMVDDVREFADMIEELIEAGPSEDIEDVPHRWGVGSRFKDSMGTFPEIDPELTASTARIRFEPTPGKLSAWTAEVVLRNPATELPAIHEVFREIADYLEYMEEG